MQGTVGQAMCRVVDLQDICDYACDWFDKYRKDL